MSEKEDLLDIAEVHEAELYQLRHYDCFDYYWIDIGPPGTKEQVQALYNKETKNGTEYTEYKHGAYFKIFPAATRMIYDAPMDEPECDDEDEDY